MKKFILASIFLQAIIPLVGQTHIYPAQDTNNTYSGQNTFNNTAIFNHVWAFGSGAVSNQNLNLLFAGVGCASGQIYVPSSNACDPKVSINSNHAVVAPNITYHTPADYGAKANGTYVYDAAMASGSCIVTSAAGGFANAAPGMIMLVVGAGNASWDGSGQAFTQTIASVQSANQVTLNQDASSHCAYQAAPAPTNGNWNAVYGTDDSAALNSCAAAVSAGGRCTLPQGQTITYASSMQFISSTQALTPGGKLDGVATLVFIPIAPLTFPTNETGMWFNATQRATCQQITSASIPIGSTSFTVASSSAYASMLPGDWIIIGMQPIAGVVEQTDWAQFLSGSGTTVNLMHPTRTAFTNPVAFNGSTCQGLSFFGIAQNSVPTSITLADFTMIVPNVQDATPHHVTAIDAQFTRGLIKDNITVLNAGERDFAANFDQRDISVNSHFNESYRSEYTNSVDDVLINDSWDNTPSAITAGLAYGTNGGISSNSAGPSVSYGAGFYTLSNLKIHNPHSFAAIAAYSGFHDSYVSDITIDYSTSVNNPTAGMIVTGGYNNRFSRMSMNGVSAAAGTTGLLIQNDLQNSVCFPISNNQWDNIAAPGYLTTVGTNQCNGVQNTNVGTDIDPMNGALRFSSPIETIFNASFGSTVSPGLFPLTLIGSPSAGMQQCMVGLSTANDCWGTLYSSGSVFNSYNAGQTTYNVDQWTQYLASVGSTLLEHDITNGLNWYTSASGTANNTFANFWTKRFTVTSTGNVGAVNLFLYPNGVGTTANASFNLSAVTTGVQIAIPNANSNTVQPLGAQPNCGVAYVDSSGVQHGISCAAGGSLTGSYPNPGVVQQYPLSIACPYNQSTTGHNTQQAVTTCTNLPALTATARVYFSATVCVTSGFTNTGTVGVDLQLTGSNTTTLTLSGLTTQGIGANCGFMEIWLNQRNGTSSQTIAATLKNAAQSPQVQAVNFALNYALGTSASAVWTLIPSATTDGWTITDATILVLEP